MPLGTEIGHIESNRPALPPKGAQQPFALFGPCLLQPNGRPSQLLLITCLNFRKQAKGLFMVIVVIFGI